MRGAFLKSAAGSSERTESLSASLPPSIHFAAATTAPFTLLRLLQGRQLRYVAVPAFPPCLPPSFHSEGERRLRHVVARLGERIEHSAD